jgi:hypothetical protein
MAKTPGIGLAIAQISPGSDDDHRLPSRSR